VNRPFIPCRRQKDFRFSTVLGAQRFSMRTFFAILFLNLPLHAAEPWVSYDNRPLGSMDRPLVLRSYLPEPDIDPAVFRQHDRSAKVAKYNPGPGRDVAGEVNPVPGLVAAIGVNFGPALSYVFDTTECRLMYAWQGGFVDMTPYWGDQQKGSRQSFDYVPRLVGNLFWKTSGNDPIELAGKSISELGPRVFAGYRLEKGIPIFEFSAGDTRFTISVRPSNIPLSCEIGLTSSSDAPLGWHGIGTKGNGKLVFTLKGTELAKFQGYEPAKKITEASVNGGEMLFNQYGCAACHSIDGSKSHGPSVGKLAGTQVEIEGLDRPIIADHKYLLESIKSPNAKLVKGYPPNYMPPFALRDVEYESLVLYIQSLENPE
jgi:mono/diheme cytochrome c family protein